MTIKLLKLLEIQEKRTTIEEYISNSERLLDSLKDSSSAVSDNLKTRVNNLKKELNELPIITNSELIGLFKPIIKNRELQQFLKDNGYYESNITGNFFIMTSNALKHFQKDNNLDQTGYFGESTRSRARELVAPDFANGQTITVISPNDGEQWVWGNEYEILWVNQNITPDARITIKLRNTDTSQTIILFDHIANDGSESWVVPSTLAEGKYEVIIAAHCDAKNADCLTEDVSDAQFQIFASGDGLGTKKSQQQYANILGSLKSILDNIAQEIQDLRH